MKTFLSGMFDGNVSIFEFIKQTSYMFSLEDPDTRYFILYSRGILHRLPGVCTVWTVEAGKERRRFEISFLNVFFSI